MSERELKTDLDPREVAYKLRIRNGAYLPVDGPIEIVGIQKSFPDQREVILHLRGVSPHIPVVATVLESDLLTFAKTVLRYFDPDSLDPQSDMHNRIRRIDQYVGRLAEELLDQQ